MDIIWKSFYTLHATENYYFKNAQYIVRLYVGSFDNAYLPYETVYIEIYSRMNYRIIDTIRINNLSEIISYLQSFGIDDIISDISAAYALIQLSEY